MKTKKNQAKLLVKPEIIEVMYGRTINIGHFESVRFDLRAHVNPGENWKEVLQALKIESANLEFQNVAERMEADHGN